MKKIELSEVKDLVAYEKVREAMRAEVIALKARRRVALGPHLTVLFENRETVLFQIQEMVRTERLVHEAQIRGEVEVYNEVLPDAGELSATVFIELPGLHRLGNEEVRAEVNRFQGLDLDAVVLELGGESAPARFEAGHTKEEKMAAVHYVRFTVGEAGRAALADPAQPARLVCRHPASPGSTDLSAETRQELLRDLGY